MFTKTPLSLLTLCCIAALQISCRNKAPNLVTDTTQQPVTVTDQEILDRTLNLPVTPFSYASITLPAFGQNPAIIGADNTPASNPVTNDGATLGRVLFYDKSLSLNNTVACASCHKQENSFSDPVAFSNGFDGGKTARNAMSLANARYYTSGKFFWDERAASLEAQVLMPIQHPVEMGMTLEALETKLQGKDYYKVLFKRAFGDSAVTSDRISKALAQFVRTMVSYQSKYDAGLAALGHPPAPGDIFSNFTTAENNGMLLYQQHCGRCHGTELQIANQARNNGLDLVYTDNGVGSITNNTADNGKFKVPSLRNVAVTAPYMHDGRFNTLAEVINHYNSNIKNNPNLDPILKTPGPNGQPVRMNLTQEQQNELIAFLNTLTDNQFLTDTKYSDPFKK